MVRRKKTRMPQKRRTEKRTDYNLRLRLLKSGKPRLVIRRTSNNLTCQIVSYSQPSDKVIVSVNSTHLKKSGWKGHCGNIAAAYLTGLLCGERVKKHKIKEAVLDIGLHTSTKGSRIYAALKGALDSGLKVPHSSEILPADERISGKHIADYAQKLKRDNESLYKRRFSNYLKSKTPPEALPTHFASIKKKIAK
jgi:large subunit ribosomal protein L18